MFACAGTKSTEFRAAIAAAKPATYRDGLSTSSATGRNSRSWPCARARVSTTLSLSLSLSLCVCVCVCVSVVHFDMHSLSGSLFVCAGETTDANSRAHRFFELLSGQLALEPPARGLGEVDCLCSLDRRSVFYRDFAVRSQLKYYRVLVCKLGLEIFN